MRSDPGERHDQGAEERLPRHPHAARRFAGAARSIPPPREQGEFITRVPTTPRFSWHGSREGAVRESGGRAARRQAPVATYRRLSALTPPPCPTISPGRSSVFLAPWREIMLSWLARGSLVAVLLAPVGCVKSPPAEKPAEEAPAAPAPPTRPTPSRRSRPETRPARPAAPSVRRRHPADRQRAGRRPAAGGPLLNGKLAFKVLETVILSWDTIRFTDENGKKIHYTAQLHTDEGVVEIALFPERPPTTSATSSPWPRPATTTGCASTASAARRRRQRQAARASRPAARRATASRHRQHRLLAEGRVDRRRK